MKWEDLEYDAKYEHPHISKLMDAKIVYCADEKYKEKLDVLRHKAREIMETPFSAEDYEKAEKVLKEAEHYYAMAMISDDNSQVSEWAGGVVYYVENAVAMLNKQYFHYGVKRVYEELSAMKKRPENLCGLIDHVVSAASAASVKEHLTTLMRETIAMFHQVKETVSTWKKAVTADTIGGTYEEMYSNWRNKIYLAAATGDRHLAFMSLISANAMFAEICSEVDIDNYNILNCYDPEDLHKTADAYDDILNEYLREYKKGGISEKRYADIDAFVHDYQMNQQSE
ncbi:MAG: hypothetical protein K2K90_19445 [Lachnospiraceae bacterium]|nr:hypothetical protein [Lachnospiraceae bacterium]